MAVLDYDAGNITSVLKAFDAVGANTRVCRHADELTNVAAIVVPGVGHFEQTHAISTGCREAVHAAVKQGVPLLGICLGLQWLFEGSDEAPGIRGLGLFRGDCFRIPDTAMKVPHVGWNNIELTLQPSRLLAGLHLIGGDAPVFTYFTHSYAAPVVPETTATTTYAVPFSSVVESGRVFGVQFHPEKSGTTGLMLLSNFMSLVRS